MLMDWAGPRKFREGLALFEKGMVRDIRQKDVIVQGAILRGSRFVKCSFKVMPDGSVENHCPCYDNTERGLICSHVVALGLAVIEDHRDPLREEKLLREAMQAERVARVREMDYIQRTTNGGGQAIGAGLRIDLQKDWRHALAQGCVPIVSRLRYDGHAQLLEQVPRDKVFAVSEMDEATLYVLEDVAKGPPPGCMDLRIADFINVCKLRRNDRFGAVERGIPEVLVCGGAVDTLLHVDLDERTGELVLTVQAPELYPFTELVYLVSGNEGWVYREGYLQQLAQILPESLHEVYRRPTHLDRQSVLHFLRCELPRLEKQIPVRCTIPPDYCTTRLAKPTFCLAIKGSPASLSATLHAVYGKSVRLIANDQRAAGDFALPDPDDITCYAVRNREAEKEALHRLAETGLRGCRGDALTSLVGCRDVLHFMGAHLPELRRRGWKVELQGRIAPYLDSLDMVAPVVRIAPSGNAGWFDVHIDYEHAEGRSLSRAEVQHALAKSEAFIERDGKVILLDVNAIEAMTSVFDDCVRQDCAESDRFSVADTYTAFVKASLEALDGVVIEAPSAWLQRGALHNREQPLPPIALPGRLKEILRAYQLDGVAWLRFLEHNGFHGILADDMGLGKTLQALAWLSLDRCRAEAVGKPTLIICPTSLVDNWCEEAARFVPHLSVLPLIGANRHEKWSDMPDADLVVSSYALLRRDIERYAQHEYAVLVLDEAQHIKNSSTRNAQAAKRIRANHRLVLTGTPMENGVSDIWSIMDFLTHGYLGDRECFRKNYERPIARGDSEGEQAQYRLRHKLQPFILRRLKTDVARDLPPKIQRVASCALTRDQQMVYTELLASSRHRIRDLVATRGVNRARMEILKVLLRLRQVCCHLDLLKNAALKSEYPSAKMNLFFELLDEALDGGHRMLVFSQFVSMLSILRRELDVRGLRYSYLDGATKQRQLVVRDFNLRREIPLFLISLKAGGTGLNLTGADMVVLFDPWWNPAVEDQAIDRAYRIGQQRTVYSIKLIAKGTIEEKVMAMQQRKQRIIDATVTANENTLAKMSWDEIRELLDI